ncbi:hypothetical protein HOY80DRAFT_1079827 [Tuber brumale]|nr:hypothetical protein HOY80DRAFT_1079827 [Tuber brumale]
MESLRAVNRYLRIAWASGGFDLGCAKTRPGGCLGAAGLCPAHSSEWPLGITVRSTASSLGSWRCFDACHIFPLAYEQQWKQFNYGRWITVPPANGSDGTINSVQNGILLGSHMHRLFDCYDISINPNDNYKIVCFSPSSDPYNVAGRSLDRMFLDNPLRPPDQLLRWHFRQAVLINMKGAGGHPSGDNFAPDPDVVGGVVSGERAGAGVGSGMFGGFGTAGRV